MSSTTSPPLRIPAWLFLIAPLLYGAIGAWMSFLPDFTSDYFIEAFILTAPFVLFLSFFFLGVDTFLKKTASGFTLLAFLLSIAACGYASFVYWMLVSGGLPWHLGTLLHP